MKDYPLCIYLDKHELGWLLTACLCGSHLRSATVERVFINKYNGFPPAVRLYLWITTLDLLFRCKYTISDSMCGIDRLWFARYDPQNQYFITVKYDSGTSKFNAFKYDGKYYISSTRFVAKSYIIKIEQDTSLMPDYEEYLQPGYRLDKWPANRPNEYKSEN